MIRELNHPRRSLTALLSACFLFHLGCGRQERPVVFEPNLVHAMKYQITGDIPMEQATKDATWVATTMFGTPDEPKLPEIITEDPDLASLVSQERLVRASGPVGAEGRGLFREHCVTCHGVTGNGRGPTASVQMPYPRDYRMGIFKFKSTPRGVKPTRSDLARSIRNGITGTAMNKIPALSDEDIESLVDYVIYLSMRGELERILIDEGVRELDLEAGDRITNGEFGERLRATPELGEKLAVINEDIDGEDLLDYETYLAMKERLGAESGLEERLEKGKPDEEEEPQDEEAVEKLEQELDDYKLYKKLDKKLADDAERVAEYENALTQTTGQELNDYQLYQEAWEYDNEYVVDIAESWLEAEDEVLDVPEPPEGLPLAGSHQEYQSMLKGDQATELAASVARGQELFVGKIASCSKCHGEKGLGDGQTTDYDDWTKDWTTRVNLKPEDRDALIPLLARGALPPINAIPRNFQEGIFRGGSTSADLYRRITQGIDGTPMPAATFVEGQFEKDDVWHVINFIRSMQTADAQPGTTSPGKESPEPDETPAV